jgi:Icc-related predicted phosphoesterase
MLLHIVSDLHLAHNSLDPFPVIADALILAGDIVDGLDMRACNNLERLISNYKIANVPCLWILGNHEWELLIYPDNLDVMHQFAKQYGLHLLLDDHFDLLGCRIFGGTLWTNFQYGGDFEKNISFARRNMGDFLTCYFRPEGEKPRMLLPSDTITMHNLCLEAMKTCFNDWTGPRVIVTHHAPHFNSMHPKFTDDPLNACFFSDLSNVISELSPDLWIHGHCHTSFDYNVGATRVICNPLGSFRSINPSFDSLLLLEIPSS